MLLDTQTSKYLETAEINCYLARPAGSEESGAQS